MIFKDVNITGIVRRGHFGIHRQSANEGEIEFFGNFFHMAFAEHMDLFAAIGAFDIRHIFHDAEDGHVHLLRHIHGFADDHRNQFLRRGHDNETVHGQRLEHRQSHIAGAGRHIHKHIIHITPDHIGPELFHGAANHGAAPDDGLIFFFKEQIDGHDFNAVLGQGGNQAFVTAFGTLMDAEALRDGRTGEVRIENGRAVAAAVHILSQHRSDERFPHAAFTTDHADNFFHAAVRIGFLFGNSLSAVAIQFAAFAFFGSAFFTRCMFCHNADSFFLNLSLYYTVPLSFCKDLFLCHFF